MRDWKSIFKARSLVKDLPIEKQIRIIEDASQAMRFNNDADNFIDWAVQNITNYEVRNHHTIKRFIVIH